MSTSMDHGNALAPGTRLLWYAIERVLGQGAFGITYLAEDTNLHRRVAIKEFMPAQLARREVDGTVEPLTTELITEFSSGRQRFIDEARTLARFEHPNIVRVHNVFEANGTAYMVMQYEEGEGLDRLLQRRGTLAEDDILRILHPLLDGLAAVHAQGFLHRDIKPPNIFIRRDGTPVLLDFGSARQSLSGDARTLTNFVSPGYAPIEQYAGKSDSQGPWSDIYGLGATLYRAMTGKPPLDAIERSLQLAHESQDTYESVTAQTGYSTELTAAVDAALRFRAADRPQSVSLWRNTLPHDAGRNRTLPATSALVDVGLPTASTSAARNASGSRDRRLFAGIAAMVVVVLVILAGRDEWGARLPGDGAPLLRARTAPAADEELSPSLEAAGPTASSTDPTRTRIAALLYDAHLDLEALRLTSPAGNNAYEKYREVLALEPHNADAGRGIEAIADRYVGLAYRDIERREFARAETYLRKAGALLPSRASVLEARSALDSTRAAAASAQAAETAAAHARGAKFQAEFDSFVREQKDTQSVPEKTRANDLLRRLGGDH